MIINSRADLEALRGGAEFVAAMALIYGASQYWALVDDEWQLQQNPQAYEQFGFTEQQFAAEVLDLEFPEPSPPDAPPQPEPPTLEDMIAAKLTELDDYRWQMEVGGAAFGGGMIRTDWNSQNKIAAAYIMAINDPDYEIPVWEVVPGMFMPLDNATIRALGVTVRDHVQATFNRKAQLHPIIAALESVEAVEAFDIAGNWEISE